MLLRCPHCGLRSIEEFAYRGDATVLRPEPRPGENAGPDARADAMYRYVHIRTNPRGRHHEHWQHVGGCRGWLVAERDTATHEVFGTCDARAFALARHQGMTVEDAFDAARRGDVQRPAGVETPSATPPAQHEASSSADPAVHAEAAQSRAQQPAPSAEARRVTALAHGADGGGAVVVEALVPGAEQNGASTRDPAWPYTWPGADSPGERRSGAERSAKPRIKSKSANHASQSSSQPASRPEAAE